MKYLLIENKGEISVDALILMGGTTKRDSKTTIGFFGSGNKYSIATLLNKNIPFRIFSGEREIIIEVKPYDFRGTILNKIYVDGVETSLTTSMGPEWEAWFAIREWYSNAIDEGNANVVLDAGRVNSKEGYTRFYIEVNKEIQDIIDSWDNYFTFDRVDCIEEKEGNKVFPQTDSENSLIYYRRGIRCDRLNKMNALYQYDLKNIEINESRTTKNAYGAKLELVSFLNTIENEGVLRNILKNASTLEKFENDLPWDNWTISKLSSTFRKAIGDHRIIVESFAGYFVNEQQNYNCYIVSFELAKAIKKSFPEVVVYGLTDDGKEAVKMKKVEPTPKMKFLLKEVERFFEEASYEVNYPIEITS